MNGDISRVTFNPLKHFTSIVLQQGRVQMDADGNEQAAILLHFMRSLAADLIGQHGGPDDVFTDPDARTGFRDRMCGFAIIGASGTAANPNFFPDAANMTQSEKDALTAAFTAPQRFPLAITVGHYYVDGVLCENETPWLIGKQPYLERGNDQAIRDLNDGVYLLYLDIWERFVTSMDDPSLKEVALGGADTAGRAKLTWQVRIHPDALTVPSDSCTAFNPAWPPLMDDLRRRNRGLLKARAKASENVEEDVCITSPEARYRGIENQLYRVEVHRGGPPANTAEDNLDVAATFKWSRNNATVVAALKDKRGDQLIVSGLRDLSRWFKTGDWVELTHDALELNGLPGTLVRLAAVDGEVLTIDPYTTSGTIFEPDDMFENLKIRNPKVRGWDHTQPEEDLLIDGAIPIEEGDWIELEDGVQVLFQRADPADLYRSGDYWLIPARVATGDVEWPQETVPDPNDATETINVPAAVPPHGIEHHFAPLAAVTLTAGAVTQIIDLRHRFAPLARCPLPRNQ